MLIPAVLDKKRFVGALEVGQTWRASAAAALLEFLEPALDAPVFSLRSAIASGRDSFFRRIGNTYKQASTQLAEYLSKPIPKAPDERVALIDLLLDVQAKRKRLRDEESYLAQNLGEMWRGEQTDFSSLQRLVSWMMRVEDASPNVRFDDAINLHKDTAKLSSVRCSVEPLRIMVL